MKMSWGSGGIAPRIFELGSRWRWVVSLTPRPLYLQGKNPWYPFDRRLGGPQSRSGRGGEEKFPATAGNRTPIVHSVAQRYTDWAIMALMSRHAVKNHRDNFTFTFTLPYSEFTFVIPHAPVMFKKVWCHYQTPEILYITIMISPHQRHTEEMRLCIPVPINTDLVVTCTMGPQ
jgi:hypothetical protein